jgi:hypothetical protein
VIKLSFRQRCIRAALLLGGLIASQFILFGPSLIGRKILLPLDNLGKPGCYLSPADAAAWGRPWDWVLTDPVLELEMDRQFAISEVRAGRLPLWNPHEYCGQPFLAANQTAVFSPFRLLDYVWRQPAAIAWDQVLKALVAGIGAYLFFRSAIGTDFFSALIGAWLWPLSGFYIQWLGYPLSSAAAWLPLIFLLTDKVLRQPWVPWVAGLALASCASLLSGHAATAGQVLLADGVFFLWRIFDLYGWKGIRSRVAIAGMLAVVAGWVLGAMLSAPQSLPTIAYLRTSHRMMERMTKGSETPSVGISAIPQLVLPDFNGASRGGGAYFSASGNMLESASVGYVGLITALVLAPLSVYNKKRRFWLIFSVALAILGMGQIVGLPILSQLYDSFPLNLMRENRLALITGWAILIAGVIGLEALREGEVQWRKGLWLAVAAPVALGAWSLVRAISPPDELRQILASVRPEIARDIAGSFDEISFRGFALCMLTVVVWVGVACGLIRHRWFVYGIGLMAVCEAITTDYNIYPQCDPAMYYPIQPILSDLAKGLPGRVCAVHCFPACLTETSGLFDVRGYDAADPQRLIDLAYLTQPGLFENRLDESGFLQEYFPAKFPSPVTRIMNLRYLIFTGSPAKDRRAKFVEDGYWVYEDRHCLPRTFVPHKVEVVDDPAQRLRLIGRPDFNPAETAYVESPGKALDQSAGGEAQIVSELPCHLTIDFNMRTSGIIVLSDLWDEGWRARVNGVDVPVLRVNHAFRGVLAPAGNGVLQYDYKPPSFVRGIELAAVAAAILLIWSVVLLRKYIVFSSAHSDSFP